MNIIDKITDNLGVPQLQQIDANTLEPANKQQGSTEVFYQNAVPAVLLGLYKFSRIKEGNTDILLAHTGGNLMQVIFGEDYSYAVSKVASHTNVTNDYAATEMEKIARAATEIIREKLPANAKDEQVRTFFTDQRNTILKYLPAGLHLGDVVHDETIDDRTNKMDGPMSGHMHWIEKWFSFNDRKKEENW
jgi:hypothetical protein